MYFEECNPDDKTKCPSNKALVFFKISKDFLCESISFIFVSNYFKFHLIIRDLKNFTNFIAELKQKGIKFKIIRHEDKRNAFTQKILRYFKKD